MIDVTVVILEGGLPSTSVVPLEIFTAAGSLWGSLMGTPAAPRFRVRSATLDGRQTHSVVPMTMGPTAALRDVRHTDLIVVPAIGQDLEGACAQHAPVIDWLARRHGPRTAVAGICTGVVLIAAAGLLDGKVATTHWAIVDRCRALYPRVLWNAERFVTESGNIYCSGGVYGSIDLCLYLVERYCGHEVALQTAKSLLLEPPRVWQSAFAERPPRLEHDDEPIQSAQRWLFSSYRREIDLEALAAKVGMSPRNFARRFRAATGETPLAYLHRLRIDRAKHLLERTSRSVQEVGREVGYEDVAFFRDLFRRHAGVSPRAYRARFGPRPRASGG